MNGLKRFAAGAVFLAASARVAPDSAEEKGVVYFCPQNEPVGGNGHIAVVADNGAEKIAVFFMEGATGSHVLIRPDKEHPGESDVLANDKLLAPQFLRLKKYKPEEKQTVINQGIKMADTYCAEPK